MQGRLVGYKETDRPVLEVLASAVEVYLEKNKTLEILDSQKDSLVVDKVVDTLLERKPWFAGNP